MAAHFKSFFYIQLISGQSYRPSHYRIQCPSTLTSPNQSVLTGMRTRTCSYLTAKSTQRARIQQMFLLDRHSTEMLLKASVWQQASPSSSQNEFGWSLVGSRTVFLVSKTSDIWRRHYQTNKLSPFSSPGALAVVRAAASTPSCLRSWCQYQATGSRCNNASTHQQLSDTEAFLQPSSPSQEEQRPLWWWWMPGREVRTGADQPQSHFSPPR